MAALRSLLPERLGAPTTAPPKMVHEIDPERRPIAFCGHVCTETWLARFDETPTDCIVCAVLADAYFGGKRDA